MHGRQPHQQAAACCLSCLWLLLVGQMARLTAVNAKLKGQIDSLSSSNSELLDRMSALTGKWRSTVADSQELHRQNMAAQEQVAALQQQLAQLQQVLARQQQPSSAAACQANSNPGRDC
jgi:peptidoglycan hydrolase CwlO-like protein